MSATHSVSGPGEAKQRRTRSSGSQPEATHQPLDVAVGDRDASPVEQKLHRPGAVDAVMRCVELGPHRPRAACRGPGADSELFEPVELVVIGGWDDRQAELGQHSVDRRLLRELGNSGCCPDLS